MNRNKFLFYSNFTIFDLFLSKSACLKNITILDKI